MSRIAISGNVSGTGVFTLASPATNTDRTLTLPDEAGTVLTSVSAVAASQITSALNATGSAPIYACRAWVNFNQQGTQAILGSGNVSSITDGGVSKTQVNFATAMPDANYAQVIGVGDFNVVFCERIAMGIAGNGTKTTSFTNIHLDGTAGALDYAEVCLAIFR